MRRLGSIFGAHAVPILLAVTFLAHVPHFLMPITGEHKWRQCDTAAVSRNYFQESMNFLLPRIDVRTSTDTTGISAMELPVFNYVVAVAYVIAGRPRESFGKLLAFFFGMLFLWALVKTIRLDPVGRSFPQTSVSAYVVLAAMLSPFLFRYTALFMPETMALFCSVFGFYCFYRFLETDRGWPYLFLSSVALCLGALIRPYVIFLGLPLLWSYLFSELSARTRLRVLLAGAAVIVPFVVWYYVWVPHLYDQYPNHYRFFMGSFASSWGGGGRSGLEIAIEACGDPWLWLGAARLIGGFYLGWALTAVFALGVLQLFLRNRRSTAAEKTGARRVVLAATVPWVSADTIRVASIAYTTTRLEEQAETGNPPSPPSAAPTDSVLMRPIVQLGLAAVAYMLAVPVIAGHQFLIHQYYLLPLMPILLVGVCVGFVTLGRWRRTQLVVVGVAVALAILDVRSTYTVDMDVQLLEAMRPAVEAQSAKSDLFVVDGEPSYLYYVGRKGSYGNFHEDRGRYAPVSGRRRLPFFKALGMKFALLKKRTTDTTCDTDTCDEWSGFDLVKIE
jgi:hypothetical protein